MSNARVINYEALLRDAMRGIVKGVLEDAAGHGLPGDHHFYISFDTLAPGVILSKRLREKYAEEMTIVLQHRFWDLVVSDEQFEVKLTFDGIPERLVVPFKAIKVFFDPSVRYVLQFEAGELAQTDGQSSGVVARDDCDDAGQDNGRQTQNEQPPTQGLTEVSKRNTSLPAEVSAQVIGRAERNSAVASEKNGSLPEVSPDEVDAGQGEESAEIVNLDAFRKK